MTPSTRHGRENACLKKQEYAAAAHDLAACALDVALSASEAGKQLWLSAARDAQETVALEAKAASDQLLKLVETAHDQVADDRPREENRQSALGEAVENQKQTAAPRGWRRRAIARLSRIYARNRT